MPPHFPRPPAQFTCTCCTKQHVAGLYRLLAPALQHQQHAGVSQAAAQGSGQPRAGEGGQEGGEAEGLAGGDDGVDEEEAGGQGGLGGQAPVGLSGRCADMMALMACRVCDPEVRRARRCAARSSGGSAACAPLPSSHAAPTRGHPQCTLAVPHVTCPCAPQPLPSPSPHRSGWARSRPCAGRRARHGTRRAASTSSPLTP